MSKNILIYSKKIAKASETFIIEPAMALKRYQAYFVASLRRYDLPIPDERVFAANTGQGKFSLAKQSLKRRILGHNGVPYLASTVSKVNPLLLQAHFAHEAVNAMPLAKKLNIPFIIYYHGLDATVTPQATEGNAFWKNYFQTLPELQKSATLVLTQSDFLRDTVIEKGFPAEKVQTQYVGVEPTDRTPLSREERKPIVLFTARLVEKKGLTYLLTAMSAVQKRYPELELVVVGDGILREELEAQTKAESVNCRFIGWQSPQQVQQWMQKALIFCVPSITAKNGDSEGFGMVFIEAQRYGTPVVSTLHGGIVESVADGETGILVQEKDSPALAKSIERLYTDSELWQKFSQNSYERVRTAFNLHTLVEKLEATYDHLIEKWKK